MTERYLKFDTSNEEVIKILKEKIRQWEPYSMARFGDGEVCFYLGNNATEPELTRRFKKRILKRWGYKYPNDYQKARGKLKAVTKYAVENSELLGFLGLTPDGPHRWFWNIDFAKSLGYDENKHKIYDGLIVRKKEFGNIYSMRDIIQGKPTHIISMYVNELKKRKLEDYLETEVTYTQTPKKQTIDDYQNLLKTINIEKSIVLFGVSNAGKNTGAFLARERGCIGIDMGAVLGAWAGDLQGSHKKHGDDKWLVI